MTTPVVTVVDPTYVATAVSTAVGNAPKHLEFTSGATGTLSAPLTSLGWSPPVPCTLFGVQVTAGPTLGTSLPIIVDVFKNGVSIFSNPSNRPTLAVGATTGFTPASNASTTSFSADDVLTEELVQNGTGAAGYTVQVYLTPLA